jgi:protein-S-isoprenylcysteine O-methyltransferase Ste14
LSRIRVPAGFVLAAFYFYYSRPTPTALAIGALIGFAGLLVRAWATGHLRKNDQLAVTGPYAYTRNPLYFGSLLLGLGFCIAGRNLWILGAFLVGFTLLYGNVILQERGHLESLFPEEYNRYKKEVPLFFPRLKLEEKEKGQFRFDRYRKNREYQALLGFLAAMGLLIIKLKYQ